MSESLDSSVPLTYPDETCSGQSYVLRDRQLLSWTREVLEACCYECPLCERGLLSSYVSTLLGSLGDQIKPTQKKMVLNDRHQQLHEITCTTIRTWDLDRCQQGCRMHATLHTCWVIEKLLKLGPGLGCRCC